MSTQINGKNIIETSQRAIHILNNLRFWTKHWEKHYGYDARKAKKKWEEQADAFLKEFDLPTNQTNNVD